MAACGHVGFGEAEGGVDRGGAEFSGAEQVDEIVEGIGIALELLGGAEVCEAGAFEGGDPDGGARADRACGRGPAGEVDAEESRFAHGGKVNGIDREANRRDTSEA